MEYEEGADAAHGISHNQTQGEGCPLGDEADTVTDSLHRMLVEMPPHPPCRAAKQRLGAKAETHESREQGQDARRPLAPQPVLEDICGMREFRRHARHRVDQLGEVHANRVDAGGHHILRGIIFGLGRSRSSSLGRVLFP